jgi:pimeloyl-ACP methyl ester carboxylesterase
VIVFDRPGLGWSTRPRALRGILTTEAETPRQQARILRQAADRLGVQNPIVLGHSYGGAVAMAWALEHPDTAAAVMVGAVSHPWPGDLHWQYPLNGSLLGGALFVPLVTAFVSRSYVDSVIGSIFEPQAAPEGYAEHVAPLLSLRRSSLRANARQVNGLRPHIVEMSEDYPALSLPIEIVHGDADEIVPLSIHSEPLAERVQSARLTVLEGVGHMPHHVAEDDVVAAIDRAAERAGLR